MPVGQKNRCTGAASYFSLACLCFSADVFIYSNDGDKINMQLSG